MKWFKHMTNSHDDEGLAHIIDVYGAKGFGIWWLLLEIIAGQMDKTDKCSVKYPEKRWCKLLGTRKEYLRQILTSFADHLDIIVRSSSDDPRMNQSSSSIHLEIKIPNLLKFRDNYTKDLVVTDKFLPSIEVEVEVEEEEEERGETVVSFAESDKIAPGTTTKNPEPYPLKSGESETEPIPEPLKPVKTKKPKLTWNFAIGQWENLEETQATIWISAFPAINIEQEMARAGAWLSSNPKNRKTDYLRYLNNWLSRAQDRARPGNSQAGETPGYQRTSVEEHNQRVLEEYRRRKQNEKDET